MALLSVLENVRYWILAGVVCAFLVGSVGDMTSDILILVLIVQMSLSMDGLVLRKKDISDNSKGIIWSAVFCFVICSGSALLMGLIFKGAYPELWNGWVMLASVPCAVSVITFALYMKGDMVLSVLATTVIYIMALVITPVMTMVFAGDSISPLQILKYVVLFIVVPLAMTYPLKYLHLNRTRKVIGINIMMFMMVMLSVGFNRDYFFTEPAVVLYISIACVFRTFVVSMVLMYALRRSGADRGRSFVYIGMAVWKNSGLASTLCIMLLADTPEAVLPCVISLLVETIWFGIMSGYFEKKWPAELGPGDPRPAKEA